MANGSILVVRHAEAGDPDPKLYPDDSARPITKGGTKKFIKAAKGLKNIVKADRVLTSQSARCIQTAALLEWDAGYPAAVAYDVLDDGHSPKQVIDDIKALDEWPCTVALVGHGPNLAELIAWLVVGYDSSESIDKGGAALVKVPKKIKPGSGFLAWQMTQKELKQHR